MALVSVDISSTKVRGRCAPFPGNQIIDDAPAR
jgi:hypothetical protein